MWQVVEANPEAADELISRHPELAGELARRRVMVRGLKKLKPESRADVSPPPPFRLAVASSSPAIGRSMSAAVVALVLAAIGLASFTVSYLMAPDAPDTTRGPVGISPPKQGLFAPGRATPTPHPSGSLSNLDPEPSPATQSAEDRMEAPIAIQMTGASLSSALKAIAAQGRFEVVLAPGMTDDPTISVKYESISPKAILEDLGKKYGFTAYDQGDGTILVVPAVDSQGTGKPVERTGPPESQSSF
jgi:hypothetical protein